MSLILNSLRYHWRTHLAVLLGVVAGTAVIGGALIVGDSVRGSLREMSLARLGGVDHVLHSQRFFREGLADDVSAIEGVEQTAPGIIVPASAALRSDDQKTLRRIGRLTLYGIDARFAKLHGESGFQAPAAKEIVLNARVAAELLGLEESAPHEELAAIIGKKIQVFIEVPSTIPKDSLLGDRKKEPLPVAVKVSGVLPAESGLGRFGLRPNQQLPAIAFANLTTVQEDLELEEEELEPNRGERLDERFDQIVTIPPRVNAIFVKATGDQTTEAAATFAEDLTEKLATHLKLIDLSLYLRKRPGSFSLESRQMMIEKPITEAARKTAKSQNLTHTSVLVYLANEVHNETRHAGKTLEEYAGKSGYSMYSAIGGVRFPLTPPFGPFEFQGNAPQFPLAEKEAVINDWLATDLDAKVGDVLKIRYHTVGSHGELPEEEATLKVAGIVRLRGAAADRAITPYVKGITDVKKFENWKQPFPLKDKFITDRDKAYVGERVRGQPRVDFGATPKIFLQLEAARKLFPSKYGNSTSLRLTTPSGNNLDAARLKFRDALLKQVEPAKVGLFFLPVKYQGLRAASGTTDFTGLFVGFSFFLILSATILIGLLFRLGIERRVSNIGLLGAIGFPPRRIGRLLLIEGMIVVIAGGLLGLLAAIGYAKVMVYGLRTWWVGAVRTRFLDVHIGPMSVVYGFLIAVIIAAIAIWWSLRQLKQVSIRQQLGGQVEAESVENARGSKSFRTTMICAGLAGVLVLASLIGVVPASEAFSGFSWQIVVFFLVGVLLLTASISGFALWLRRDTGVAVRGGGVSGTARLGMRNASRSRSRSLFTAGLIASATFVIAAVAAGRRDPSAESPVLESGNGGFLLVAETGTPILDDLNTAEAQIKLNLRDAKSAPLSDVKIHSFLVRPGEDASCLNLYQTRLPTLLGAAKRFRDRGGFKWVGADRENPWSLLEDTIEADVPTIPVVGDMNTLMYSLHKGVGDEISVPDEDNPEYRLRIVGMLDSSIFQGVLVMSEENFRRHYPEEIGSSYFLIEAPESRADELSSFLETRLDGFGFDTERVTDRIATFLTVQNTYLSTFQTLGGLGLLLGTLGLATVMLRNVFERRSELALLRAIGFRRAKLAAMVLWENAFLLLWGLLAGAISALLAMLPHLMTVGADLPASGLFGTLGAVFVVGMLAALFAVREASSTPIVSTLREE